MSVSAVTIALVLAVVLAPIPVSAQQTRICIDPWTAGHYQFNTPDNLVCHKWNITVYVEDVADLFAYQVYLTVDDDVLNITGAWLPLAQAEWVFFGKLSLQSKPALYDLDADGNMESVKVGDSLLGGQPTFRGSGILAVIELHIKVAPACGEELYSLLGINNVDTYLLDSNLDEILYSKENGYYSYTLLCGTYPTMFISPPLFPPFPVSEIFTADIKVADTPETSSWEFFIAFDPTLVECISIEEGPFLKSTGGSTYFVDTIDNTLGRAILASIMIQPFPSVWPSGSGTLANITFHCLGEGSTNLHPFYTGLYDSSNDPIPHAAYGGGVHQFAPPPPPPPVGGVWLPIDKLGLLAPYLCLVSAIAAAVTASGILVKRKRK